MDRNITSFCFQISNTKFKIWITKRTPQIISNTPLNREKAFNTTKKKQVGFQWACTTKATKAANKLVKINNTSYGIIKPTSNFFNWIFEKRNCEGKWNKLNFTKLD